MTRSGQVLTLSRTLPPQRELLRSRASRLLFLAGVGSGKTRGLVYWALRKAVKQPGVQGALFAPSFRLFKRVVLPTWREVVPRSAYTWRVADQVIEMANGTVIYCMGTDRAVERVVGLNLGWAGMDEAGVARDEVVPKLIMQRIRVGVAAERQLALFTSPHGYGWLRDWSEQRTPSGQHTVHLIRSTTYDNPYLPPGYISDLEIDFPPGTLQHRQEMLGEFVVVAGLVYGDIFNRAMHVVPEGYDYERPYSLGWDPGSRASGVVAVQVINGQHVVVREWTSNGEWTEDTAECILRDMQKPPLRVWTDTPSKLNTRTKVDDLKALRAIFGRGTHVRALGGERRTSAYRHRALSSALRHGRLAISQDLVSRRASHAERGIVHALETMPWPDESTRLERTDEKSPLKHIIDALEFYVSKELPPKYADSESRAKQAEKLRDAA